jgi:hypothetical protein
MAKTAFHRFRARRQAEDSYALAAGAAALQLARGQAQCGVELSVMLLDALHDDKAPPEPAALDRALATLRSLPAPGGGAGGEAAGDGEAAGAAAAAAAGKLASSAARWLRAVGGDDRLPRVEGELAAALTRALGWRGLGAALPHYAASGDMAALGAAVAAAAARGRPEEADLFAARAALAAAAAGGPARGRAAAAAVAAAAPTGQPAAPPTPLARFVDLFLEALERRSAPLCALLLERYAPSLARDPGLAVLAVRARDAGVPAAAGARGAGGAAALAGGGPVGGMIGDLMASLMGGTQ